MIGRKKNEGFQTAQNCFLFFFFLKPWRKKKNENAEERVGTVGAEGSAGDMGELFAGIDVLENGFVEAGEMLVALLEHRLYPVGLHPETHHFWIDRRRRV